MLVCRKGPTERTGRGSGWNRVFPSAGSATTACCCRSPTTAGTGRRFSTRHGCAAIRHADSTSASTTGRSASGEPSVSPPSDGTPGLIRAIVFDLDNTLVDFMKMKSDAVEAAIDGMIDAGLGLPREAVKARIDPIYQAHGLEYQRVFDALLESELGRIDPRILASGIV